MSRGRTYECGWCDETFSTATAHMLHVSAGCPQEPGPGEPTRSVSCPACADQIDLRRGRTCPTCGREYVGRMGVEFNDVAGESRRNRPAPGALRDRLADR